MSNTLFTSDLHFYHKNIIQYSDRPYKSVEEMNEGLISNWNGKVNPDDTVYIIGDFIFAGITKMREIHDRLNGKKILIKGNHDPYEAVSSVFEKVYDYKEIKIDEKWIILMHFPIEEWHGKHRGSIHLHGHAHGTSRLERNRLDVGVDPNYMVPLTLDEALGKIEAINQYLDGASTAPLPIRSFNGKRSKE